MSFLFSLLEKVHSTIPVPSLLIPFTMPLSLRFDEIAIGPTTSPLFGETARHAPESKITGKYDSEDEVVASKDRGKPPLARATYAFGDGQFWMVGVSSL